MPLWLKSSQGKGGSELQLTSFLLLSIMLSACSCVIVLQRLLVDVPSVAHTQLSAAWAISISILWRWILSWWPSVFSNSVFTLSWQSKIAFCILCRFHWVLGRASSSVKTPSRILRTCVHTADDFSSRPISWMIFRRYCWVSCKQWTSRRTERFVQKKQSVDRNSDLVCKSRHHSQLCWKNWFGRRNYLRYSTGGLWFSGMLQGVLAIPKVKVLEDKLMDTAE